MNLTILFILFLFPSFFFPFLPVSVSVIFEKIFSNNRSKKIFKKQITDKIKKKRQWKTSRKYVCNMIVLELWIPLNVYFRNFDFSFFLTALRSEIFMVFITTRAWSLLLLLLQFYLFIYFLSFMCDFVWKSRRGLASRLTLHPRPDHTLARTKLRIWCGKVTDKKFWVKKNRAERKKKKKG